MTDGPTMDGRELEGLLRERQQYQAWLAKLDANAGQVTAAVATRVRADYEGRLATVLDALRRHEGAVRGQLDRLQSQADALEARDQTAADRLAEAQLRHLVGEYDEAAWATLQGEVGEERRTLQADLAFVRQEIARFDDVLAIILETPRADVPVPPALVAVAEPELEPEPEPAPEPEPVVAATPVAAVEPTPVAAEPLFPVSKPKPIDELDFLKSVTDDTLEAPVPAAAPRAATAPVEAGKTLRCRSCGTMNRPSDWYCEGCSGELSDLG